MANGNFPGWEEWDGLTEEQRRYSKYKILQDMNTKLTEMHRKCDARPLECGKCFMSIKDGKWLSWGMKGIYAGGFVVIIIEVVKRYLWGPK